MTTKTILVPNSCYRPAWALRPGVKPLPAFVEVRATAPAFVAAPFVEEVETDPEVLDFLAMLAAGERALRA